MRRPLPTATSPHSLPSPPPPLPGAAEPAPQRHRVGETGHDRRPVTQLQVLTAGPGTETSIVTGPSRLQGAAGRSLITFFKTYLSERKYIFRLFVII